MRKRRLQFETLEPRDYLAVAPQSLPLAQDFNLGLPDENAGWEFASTNDGVISATGGSLAMSDSKADSVFSLNEAILHVDLSAAPSVDLTLDHSGADDEQHPFAKTSFVDHTNAD